MSGIGFVLYRYGRSRKRPPHVAIGAVMLVYPYFVGDVGWMLALAPVCLGLAWLSVRVGL